MERLVPSQLISIALKKSSDYIVVNVHFPRSCLKCNTHYAAGVKVVLEKAGQKKVLTVSRVGAI